MTRPIYSLLLYLLFPLVILYLCLRSVKSAEYRKRWGERFGLMNLKSTDVMFHCVSMGETLAAVELIKQLMQQYPHLSFTVTTTSPTGSEQVINAFGDSVQHCYLPFDFSYAAKRFIRKVNPSTLVIMETELWPNLIHFAKQSQVSIVLANARLSAKSAAKYQAKPKLSIPMLQSIDLIIVQTQQEFERFAALGVAQDKLLVSGSLKFDLKIAPELSERAKQLRLQWQRPDAPIWVAGSVHPGEFDIMLEAHQQVLAQYPDALLVVVPRHPEQFDAAAQRILQQDLTLARRSLNQDVTLETQVVLGDTMGELLMIYGAAEQAFVGGTLIENGGHNPLEPAAMGLPVFVGPHHWDFAEITHLLEQAGGLQVIDDSMSLAHCLLNNIANPAERQKAAGSAMSVVDANKGALKKHLSALNQLLKTIHS
ncbi:lipid IV(A) 3-deoxy-D-manno-octulosonic acid transferase [Shewanella maritima]|uniref:lipid IV(A) 3-deoxy-D-manno-octulosonic acid transferase n=1 Tax=Shewanella maritima TaxID=2520507 RepID=UPI0037364727